MESNLVEKPIVTIYSCGGNKTLTLHNYRTLNDKVVVNKSQAALLYIELHKFIMSDD